MPATLVTNTTRLVVFESIIDGSPYRIEISGRYLTVDSSTGRVISGSVNSVSNFFYDNGNTQERYGYTWSSLNTTAQSLNSLIAGFQWQNPQANAQPFLDVMAALPFAKQITSFSPTGTYVQGTNLVELLNGTANGDVILGAGGNDRLYGRDGGDQLYGGTGDDRIYGENGQDLLHGDVGNDRLYGGSGFNNMYGGDGNDALSTGNDGSAMDGGAGNDGLIGGTGADDLRGGAGNDNLIGNAGNDTMFGDEGDDKLTGDLGNDFMNGGAGVDQMTGGFGLDTMSGGDGNDRIDGKEDSDLIFGGAGNDNLVGGLGDDIIHVETGTDTMAGGLGNDDFIFTAGSAGAQTIVDFNAAQDELLFAQFNGDTATAYQYFLDHAANVGKNVVFTDGGLTVTLARTQLSAFSQDTFGTINNGGGGGGGDIGGEIIG